MATYEEYCKRRGIPYTPPEPAPVVVEEKPVPAPKKKAAPKKKSPAKKPAAKKTSAKKKTSANKKSSKA
jgi:hypothetical protein